MKRIFLYVLSVVLLCATNVMASAFSLGANLSTLGYGLEAKYKISERFAARLAGHQYTYDTEQDVDDITYEYDWELSNYTAALDYHPFKGAFRLSLGALFNQNKFKLNAEYTTGIEIGDTVYTVDTLTGEVSFEEVVPYLTLGWDTSFRREKGFGFIAELGVFFQGEPKVEFTATGTATAAPGFSDDLETEEEDAQEDLSEFQVYPVIVLGLNYKF